MEIVVERACGMDIHKDNITACILTSKGKEIQTFSTKTVFLLQLIDWIKQHECTHVAMESTGVFWKPIVNLLEAEGIEFLVVNAQHMKALPERKTMSRIRNGLQNFFVMAYSKQVSFQIEINGNFENLFGIVVVSLKKGLDNITEFKKC